jgi:RNA polymerase sigma factor (sigma-70 family)
MEVSALPRPRGGFSVRPSPRFLARMSDERLVEQLRRGNEAAFEVIYDRHHRGILGFCRHMLRSREEAEDAVQHTFIAAYDDLVGSDKPIRLKAWLYTIARNRCLSLLRSRHEQVELPDELPTAGLSDAVVERDDLRRLVADVHGLPEDQRAALVLSELGDLSHAEIAGVVGCETVKVKALVFQARGSLMESKLAREISCQEIREELATARGGALRRGPLRRHVRSCPGCTEFREQVVAQRKMLALALPVVPTLGLKHAVLASIGGGGPAAAAGAGGAAVGTSTMASAGGAATAGGVGASGVAGGGGLLSALGTAGIATKVAIVATGVAVAGGGAVAVEQATKHDSAQSTAPGAKDGKWVDTDGDGKVDTPAGAAAAGVKNGGKAGGSETATTARELAAEKRGAAKARHGVAANGHHSGAGGNSAAHRRDGESTSSGSDDGTTTTDDTTAPGSSGGHRSDGGSSDGGGSYSSGGGGGGSSSHGPPPQANGNGPPASHPVPPPPPPQSQGHQVVPPGLQ